ncbi:4-(cytidine 5'-diphospho)-2-C-methyl-D-erythritol kinase [Kordiimonas marina]|uniref:4-(cytidine 5'-diphospho)-2-C-methyl-D-erythritol kinase n=1 Tax=Kordiimonas marina TaxID=2872312 RepID=UPI001FF4799A|nr:4-(cytidine 5'-diphospho)-2-C-methyl-D-erythritol kinase [Kordiimonas marina]MCJ9427572.1 4-(cytidine 5'-diphospho)-2-C-methyl-D-erythritol kinase [Kordiimonas marina]
MAEEAALHITAPAKVNLFLHVTGRRADGYHALESLFVFTRKGDELVLTPADDLGFSLAGPFAPRLRALGGDGEGNLVVRAARALADAAGRAPSVHIELIKTLPVEAGIGGGSADAAAVLLGLNDLWGLGWSKDKLAEIALTLGADVPACLYQEPLYVTGIGETVRRVTLPWTGALLLVNPGSGSATPAVFKAYKAAGTAFDAPLGLPEDAWQSPDSLKADSHNSLEAAALSLNPAIAEVLAVLCEEKAARLVRMSGSGATCFALFDSLKDAEAAADRLKAAHPAWWVMADEIAL